MNPSESFSPTRSPTIYSSPISSPTWSNESEFNLTLEPGGLPVPNPDNNTEIENKFVFPNVGERNVVLIRNGRKSYGSGKNRKDILKCINMTVKEGAIYGLLGASGCGKTTLLSCLVGLKNFDKRDGGQLLIYGGVPGDRHVGIPGSRVGYMPQEYALFGEFTVRETLQYFGRIYGMSKEEISTQSKFLIKLLDLPNEKSRPIRSFSGGQQRRVSFASTLLHKPDLLILDEPTVGVDPMLRQSIWRYLSSLSSGSKKTTILITTHYIEEARQATTVGLMRNGRLLAEDAPNRLLKQFDVPSLEDVFLKLCVSDNQTRIAQTGVAETETKEKTEKEKKKKMLFKKKTVSFKETDPDNQNNDKLEGNLKKIKLTKEEKLDRKKVTDDLKRITMESWEPEAIDSDSFWSVFATYFSFGRLWALMMKNFIKMGRNYSMLLLVFALPAVQVVFFCLAIGRDPSNLNLAIVNEEAPYNNLTILLKHEPHLYLATNESSNSSHQEAVEAIHSSLLWPQTAINSSYFVTHCPATNQCEFTHLSCRFLQRLTNLTSGTILNLQPYSKTEDALQAVQDGLVWGIIHINSNFSAALLDRMFNPLESDSRTRNQSKLMINLDMTNQQVNYILVRSLMESFEKFVQGLLVSCNLNTDIAKMPLDIGDPIYGTLIPNFTEFMAPGIIILISFFLAVALTGEAFISEKRDGLLDRSRVAGVLAQEILVSAVVTQFLILVGQTIITLVFILGIFQVPCNGPLGIVILLTLLQGCAGMCFGFLLSILCTSEASAMQATIGSFYPILMLSGILWPIEGMPHYFQVICWYLPCTCACQAMRDIMSRGWSVEGRMSVKLGLISSSAWIAIFLVLSIVFIKIQQKVS